MHLNTQIVSHLIYNIEEENMYMYVSSRFSRSDNAHEDASKRFCKHTVIDKTSLLIDKCQC